MTVPTQNELLDFVNTFMDRKEGYLWNPAEVESEARRHFRTTTPAIQRVMAQIIDKEMIKKILVDHSGLIHWRDNDASVDAIMAFLVEPDWKRSYERFTCGPVVLMTDRKGDYKNLWANGRSWFYISVSGYRSLTEKLKQRSNEKNEAERKKSAEQREAKRAAIKEIVPDGLKLIRRIQDSATNEHLSRVELRRFHRKDIDGGEDLYGVEISLYGEKDLTFLFDVLRRGFADLDRETVADNG